MHTTRSTSLRRHVVGQTAVAVLLVVAGAWWLTWVHAVADGAVPADLAPRALALTLLSLPVVLVAIPLALTPRDGEHDAGMWLSALVAAPVAAVIVAVAEQLRMVLDPASASGLLPAIALADDTATLLVVLLPMSCACFLAGRLRTRGLPRSARLGLVAGVCVVTAMSPGALAMSAGATPAPTTATCLTGGPVDKSFDVTAIDVDIPVNRFGDHDPLGKMYALTSAIPAIRVEEAAQTVSVGLKDDPIQPLVIRANQGDCVEISYTNSATGGDFGLHVDGLAFDISSSGDSIGANPTSAVALGQTRTFRFAVPDDRTVEGGHYMHPGPGYRAAVDHGLFGALVVEPRGSTYWDASTAGTPLLSGWEAIIKPAGVNVGCQPTSTLPTCAFREAALLHHEIGNDNEVIKDKSGKDLPVQDDTTGSYRPGGFALNYRSEPFRNRLLTFPKEKSHAYSSYTFGDPATPMMRGYLADPTKIRLMHVGAEKFHVFHLHGGGDRWRFNPVADTTSNYAMTGLAKDPSVVMSPSTRLDSQSIGPGESFNLEIEGGAGGAQQSSGDFLFHCHIAKHYVSGMWGLWRVFNTAMPDLVPLADRPRPPTAVDSVGLLGRTVNGTRITTTNIDAWIRPQLPPPGIPRSGQDATVWNWKVAGTTRAPLYLGAPADPTVYPDSPREMSGQPNLLAVDIGHVVSGRPAILFNPVNGRPAYPMFRPHIGTRPPFTPAGHSGAPWLGPNANQSGAANDAFARRADGLCPANRSLRTFNVVAINVPIRRTPTLVDPEGKIFVLAHDKQATYASSENATPLAIRANQGDCVAVTLTNEIPDSAAFDNVSKTTMHIHHVQFDVQGSDGVSAGYAFEHSVRPYQVSDPTLTTLAAKGATVIRLSDVSKFVGTDANGKAIRPWIAIGEGLESIDIRQVVSVSAANKTVTLSSALSKTHALGEFAGTEFIQYRWYPDAVLDNVFWHDHVDGIHGWGHGLVGQLIVEPAGSTYHDPATGAVVDSGTLVDIHTTNPLSPGLVEGSFRELALWTIDDNDTGRFSTLNLKANPLVARPDKANQFSSWTYGDPLTPLPTLYPGDPLVVRTINVSPTIDTLHVVGGRTFLEHRYAFHEGEGPSDQADGTIIDAIHYGVSEKFTLVLNGQRDALRLQPGDYLYANGLEARTQDGAWGIVRVLPGVVSSLQPLPGVTAPVTTYTPPDSTGGAPPATAAGPGDPCPTGAPARQFALTAMDRSGSFNGGRTAYVPSVDVPAIQKRIKAPEPLVLHVVAGECVTVALTNLLSSPVGFAVGKLDRAPESGGVNVGFSSNQNTAPGVTRSYRYYVPTDRVGTASIADLAGATTMKSGLYGVIVVAPASRVAGLSTEFSDPVTGRARDIGAQVIVHVPGGDVTDYRDFTVTLADDDRAMGQDFMPYPTNAIAGRSLVNYRAAPAGDGPASFADPGSVPRLTTYVGDPVRVHVLMAPGSEQAHVFGLGGLRWPQDPFVHASNSVSSQGMGPWETITADIIGGAGGEAAAVGDFFYGDQRKPFTAAGMWGLQRTLPQPRTGGSCPLLLVDGSVC